RAHLPTTRSFVPLPARNERGEGSGTGVPPVRIVQPTHGRDARATTGTGLRWQYALTARAGDGKYLGRQSMTLKIQPKSLTDAQQRGASAAIWRLVSGLIMGWNSG